MCSMGICMLVCVYNLAVENVRDGLEVHILLNHRYHSSRRQVSHLISSHPTRPISRELTKLTSPRKHVYLSNHNHSHNHTLLPLSSSSHLHPRNPHKCMNFPPFLTSFPSSILQMQKGKNTSETPFHTAPLTPAHFPSHKTYDKRTPDIVCAQARPPRL